MAAKKSKKAAKPLAKKAMKKTKGGAAYIKLEDTSKLVPMEQLSLNYSKIQF